MKMFEKKFKIMRCLYIIIFYKNNYTKNHIKDDV